METAPKPRTSLGRYRLVRHLASGGMAEVLLARVDGIEGFERHVVIKRIKAEQARDARFVQMFVDEARLAASLHHHNIVQVHDIGEEDGEYFFAMEYVHGEDLRKVLMHVAERNQQVPFEHCVTIALNTAAALHHAHEHRGPDRQPLGIVHRDVSPANILIGYDGNVKVVDFGIAKVTHRTTETQSGVMKGKVAYMAPEQCLGQAIDRRSDIFCLGIVLYELVTVRRLFKEDNDFLTMSAITQGVIPRPSSLRPELDPALEAIILKALAFDPADRYQTADEMRAALEQFAASAALQTSNPGLAGYMRIQFGERPVPWLIEDDDDVEISIDFDGSASGIVCAPAAALHGFAPDGLVASQSSPFMRARKKAITRPPPLDAGPASATSHATSASGARPLEPSRPWHARIGRRAWLLGGALSVVIAIVAVVASRSGSQDPAAPPPAPAVAPVVPVVVDPPAAAPVPAEPVTPPNLAASVETIPTDGAATVTNKPARPAAKKPVKKPPKGVWDPKSLLPPK